MHNLWKVAITIVVMYLWYKVESNEDVNGKTKTCSHLWQEGNITLQNKYGTSAVGHFCIKCGKIKCQNERLREKIEIERDNYFNKENKDV